jgi:hypothetical protein
MLNVKSPFLKYLAKGFLLLILVGWLSVVSAASYLVIFLSTERF